MSRPAIDLIENGSYQKAAELMLGNIYQENYTKALRISVKSATCSV